MQSLTTSAILTMSLHIELAGMGSGWFCPSWRHTGNSCGGETMVGVHSAVAVRITGGVGLTTGIVVGRTLVGVSKRD